VGIHVNPSAENKLEVIKNHKRSAHKSSTVDSAKKMSKQRSNFTNIQERQALNTNFIDGPIAAEDLITPGVR